VRPVPVVFRGAGNAGVEVGHAAGLGGERDEVASVFVLHAGWRGIHPWHGEALPTAVRPFAAVLAGKSGQKHYGVIKVACPKLIECSVETTAVGQFLLIALHAARRLQQA
jgi:hypothetical protein